MQPDYAGREDGSEPPDLAGRVADQPVGDTGFADAAFVVWIAGAGGDPDAAEPAPVWSQEFFRGDFRRLLEHSGHYDVYGIDAARRFSGYGEVAASGHVYLQPSFSTGGGEQHVGFRGTEFTVLAAIARRRTQR